jgi:hypothetical protein
MRLGRRYASTSRWWFHHRGNYGNAPATVVKTSPLTFTAVNPGGDRLVTFTMQATSLVMTGPSHQQQRHLL